MNSNYILLSLVMIFFIIGISSSVLGYKKYQEEKEKVLINSVVSILITPSIVYKKDLTSNSKEIIKAHIEYLYPEKASGTEDIMNIIDNIISTSYLMTRDSILENNRSLLFKYPFLKTIQLRKAYTDILVSMRIASIANNSAIEEMNYIFNSDSKP